MNIPVYEIHDGEAYDGFTKIITATVTPIERGIQSHITRVSLRRVESRYGYMARPLPCNYKTLDRDQVVTALRTVEYGRRLVSLDGSNMIKHHNIKAHEYQEA